MTLGLGLFVSIFNELNFRNTEYFLPMAHNYYTAEKKFELRSILAINTKNTKKGGVFYTVFPMNATQISDTEFFNQNCL